MQDRFAATASRTETEVLKFDKDTSWKFLKTMSGIDAYYMKSPHFNGNMYKFSCVIDAPHDIVYEVLKPPKVASERMAWDKSIGNYERLETFSEELSISMITSKAVMMGMISAREFLDVFLFKTITGFEAKHWVFAESVEHEKYPPKSGIVRAHTYPSGYSATPVEGTNPQTKVEFFINIDPSGMLPRSLVESALPAQQVKYIQGLKAEVFRRFK
uniref:StAR-related lipid transfer protein 5-like n=1 Tax=Phallusia mammillata TaxID=59560 RepID=A0A6F9DT68_9ASCI|nr:stAR-related lipid transfer protein 5-like [Phallusia mammillata]